MRLAPLLAVLLALGAASPPVPAAADPFFARNGHRVFSTSDPRVMEVLAQPGSAGPQFFCAAGEYARGPLRAQATDRLVVVDPVSRKPRFNGQRTVLIALVPRGSGVPRRTGLLVDPGYVGENLSVGHAQFLCNQQRRRGRLFD